MFKSFKLIVFLLLLNSISVSAQNNSTENSNSERNVSFAYLENPINIAPKASLEEISINSTENSTNQLHLLKEAAIATKSLRSLRKKRTIFHYILVGATTFGAAIAITTLGASAGR
jgi:hypothetical protein